MVYLTEGISYKGDISMIIGAILPSDAIDR